MELTEITTNEQPVVIKHPGTGRPVGLDISIMSYDDERMKSVRHRIANRRMYLEARGKTFDAEELEQNAINLWSTACTGWRWYNPLSEDDPDYDDGQLKFDGEITDFNSVNVKKVLTRMKWIGVQIQKALDDDEAFFKTSKSA